MRKIDPAVRGDQVLTLRAVGRLRGRVVADVPEMAAGLTITGMTTPGSLISEFIHGRFEVSTDAQGDLKCLRWRRGIWC